MPRNGWENVSLQYRQSPLFNGIGRSTTIPINNLMHVTHGSEASQIREQSNYTFKPSPKYGKKYGSESEGSYVSVSETTFQKIQGDERVLPGKFSWWGVNTSSWYHSVDILGQQFSAATATLGTNRIFVAPFMSNPPESPYGTHGFIVGFKDLLKCYKQSRADVINIDDRAVYLRIGGTLRYRYEVCYVVIVCTKYDDELDCYPSLCSWSNDVFDHKNLVLSSGEVNMDFFESQETVDLKVEHVIKCVPKKVYSCYETAAFAFYYPEGSSDSMLQCSKDMVTEVNVSHQCKRLCQRKKEMYDLDIDSLFS